MEWRGKAYSINKPYDEVLGAAQLTGLEYYWIIDYLIIDYYCISNLKFKIPLLMYFPA